VTVDGITVGAQSPLFDEDLHDTMQVGDACRPPRSPAGRQANMSSLSIPQPIKPP
jgi:hypothetical protein